MQDENSEQPQKGRTKDSKARSEIDHSISLDFLLIPFFVLFVVTPNLKAKKNPELVARGREADFLKGSKAR
jgi:hypothetical protein